MKRALVISGGGSKGAFAVGILQRLRVSYPLLHFDIIVGTSTGALIAPLASLEELDLLEQLYTVHTTENVVTKHRLGDRLNQKSIYSAEPLWQLIKKYITDDRLNRIMASPSDIYLVTACLQTAGTVVFTTNASPVTPTSYSLRTARDAEHLRLAIMASACQPVFMTPIKIDANYSSGREKDFQYVDGGVQEYAGVQMALDQGAEEIFCILLSPSSATPENKQYDALFPILERTISMLSEDVEKNDILLPEARLQALAYIKAVKQKMLMQGVTQSKIDAYFDIDGTNTLESGKAPRLFILRPQTSLGGGPGGLVFDPAEMKRMVQTGKGAAQDFVARLDPKDVTWLV
ncbi:MAG: patatin-like phospholipase family protein [Chitinophagaceae bacterium]